MLTEIRPDRMTIAIARLIQHGDYRRWKDHNMQISAYDNAEQGID